VIHIDINMIVELVSWGLVGLMPSVKMEALELVGDLAAVRVLVVVVQVVRAAVWSSRLSVYSVVLF
jgi:hypothetical protein